MSQSDPLEQPSTPRPLWQGRTLALLGIILVAANLRTAVTALSPIFDEIRVDVAFTSVGIGILGMLPPICFAVFGIITPLFTRRLSIESVVFGAAILIIAGHLLRAFAPSFAALAIGSAVVFAGMAIGNVLLPPLVKRYFPDRIGLMTSLYATIIAIGALVPPLIAVPVADGIGWRSSVGEWAIVGVLAAIPWLAVLIRRGRGAPHGAAVEEPDAGMMGRVWHAGLSWALAVVFAVSSLNAYAMFAWLPELLHDSAGADPASAGALLSLYSGMGIPTALLIPVLATRMKNIGVLVYVGVACFFVGDIGLIVWPGTATWVWVALAGLGPLLFPLCLVLINLRTRTHAGAVALSGFTQGLGYTLGAIGPLLVGVLHQVSGGWTWPLLFLLATAVATLFAGAVVARPVKLEDHLARVAASR